MNQEPNSASSVFYCQSIVPSKSNLRAAYAPNDSRDSQAEEVGYKMGSDGNDYINIVPNNNRHSLK